MVGPGAKKGGRENEGSREDNRGFVFLGRDEKKTQSVSWEKKESVYSFDVWVLHLRG